MGHKRSAAKALVQALMAFVVLCTACTLSLCILEPDIMSDMSVAYADDAGNGNVGGYAKINVNNIFSSEGGAEGGGLWTGAVDLIQFLVTGILLPIGIIMSTWKVLYIAIFCIIANTDPLDYLRNPKYTRSDLKTVGSMFKQSDMRIAENIFGWSDGVAGNTGTFGDSQKDAARSMLDSTYFRGAYSGNSGGQQINQLAKSALREELKLMLVGLVVTFCVWGFINVIIQIVLMFIGMAESVDVTDEHGGVSQS